MSHYCDLARVPLFPLPNVVLFPQAVLPLHIFEERYKAMMADALDGERQIAMALLRPGWEKDYYRRPAIEPVVCVGKILTHERLPDGKYNLLLQGQLRARIVREFLHEQSYRIASLKPLAASPVLEIDLTHYRHRLLELFGEQAIASLPGAKALRRLLHSPLPTCSLADLIAFNFFDDVHLKQELLADEDVPRRVGRVITELESMRPSLASFAGQRLKHPSLN